MRRHEESTHKVIAKGRKVQRLQSNKNGELVPIPDAKKQNEGTHQGVYCENVEASEYVSVLQDVPIVENTDLIYFNVF